MWSIGIIPTNCSTNGLTPGYSVHTIPVFAHTHTHAWMHKHTYCTFTHRHIHTYACMHACLHSVTHTYLHILQVAENQFVSIDTGRPLQHILLMLCNQREPVLLGGGGREEGRVWAISMIPECTTYCAQAGVDERYTIGASDKPIYTFACTILLLMSQWVSYSIYTSCSAYTVRSWDRYRIGTVFNSNRQHGRIDGLLSPTDYPDNWCICTSRTLPQ